VGRSDILDYTPLGKDRHAGMIDYSDIEAVREVSLLLQTQRIIRYAPPMINVGKAITKELVDI
jgi:hypothetical protein